MPSIPVLEVCDAMHAGLIEIFRGKPASSEKYLHKICATE
jgi:hypothetical protein